MKKAIAIALLTAVASTSAKADWYISQPTPAGAYYESEALNDALYASSESCEQQADRTVQRALPNIEAMCATTEAAMTCVINSMEAMKAQLIKDCKEGQ
jgi:hypothetical protein